MTIRRGDILWADLGMFPTTSVQGGVRPVIVVSNNKANTCCTGKVGIKFQKEEQNPQ